MKRKWKAFFCSLFVALAGTFGLAACNMAVDGIGTSETPGTGRTPEIIYAKAQELGYEGSLEDFLALVQGKDGADGTGITDVSVNDSGELIVTLTSGESINCGSVRGEQGEPGKDGIGISGAEINQEGHLILSFSDGTSLDCGAVVGTDGEDGKDGENGQDGENGIGISGITVDETGKLLVTLTDGKVIDCGSVRGEQGEPGKDGIGISGAEINQEGHLILSFSDGTSLDCGAVAGTDGEDGKDGENGQDGENGIGISGITVDETGKLLVTLTDGKVIDCGSVRGEQGEPGEDGIGISNAEINQEGHLILSFSDGTSLDCGAVVGTDGEDGKDGENGRGIRDVSINASGELVITYTDGTTSELGKVVGENGNNGVGIQTVVVNDKGSLVISLTNGSELDLGNVHGEDGQDGVGIKSVLINDDGELLITLTNDSECNLGKITGSDGTDGLSAYEIYLKYHPGYTGTEEDWIDDLVSGKLNRLETEEIDYIPELNITVAAGEDVTLPKDVAVYFSDGSVESYAVTWDSAPSSAYVGIKTIYGRVETLEAEVKCRLRITNYSSAEKYVDGYVNGILGSDEVLLTIYNETYLETTSVSGDGYFCFAGLNNGTYDLKIDANGYQPILPQTVQISSVTADESSLYNNVAHAYFNIVAYRTPGYYFSWTRTDGEGNTETEAAVNNKIVVEFLDDTQYVSNIGDASYLRDKYNVVLQDNELIWSSETSSRFLELYEKIPADVTGGLKSVWTLTDVHLQNDIDFAEIDGVYYVTVSMDAVENMTPRVAVSEGIKGKYFSNRFYNALVRFVTDNGTDADKCERILNENFSTSFNVPDYTALTAGITNEDASQFQEFYPEEKLLILTMFEEMPEGMHKMPELKYLVRRKTGQSHPIYPDAAAVTWPYAAQPYIEFMDVTFRGSGGYYETKRLIIHEKTHMYWAYYFSDELKAKWYEVGGWYQNPDDADGWSTTKQTEFVSDYAHAHNPDEDMAESVATYVLDPDLLRSRSPSKYEFIKEYIMGGSFYLTQIRDDLTFEVYNLNPDYTYPGQIDSISVKVEGGLFEDKTVSFEIVLHGSEEFEGASGAWFRLTPGDSNVNQFYDIGLSRADDRGFVLRGSTVISKYSFRGYWYTDQITISDSVGNERYESNADFSMKVFIDNPLCDLEKPELVRGSLELSLENAGNAEHPGAQYLVVKFAFTENIRLDRALVRLYCKNATKDSIDTYAADHEINRQTGEVEMRVYIPEHYSSGIYEISEISLWDTANNYNFYHVNYGTLVDENNLIEIITPTPDDEGAYLDVNDISISAVPSIPEQPNGETYVTVTVKVKDNFSGIKIGYIRFVDPQGIQHGYWMYFPYRSEYYFDGDPTELAAYTLTFTLPKGSAPGTWGIYEISLTDCALNVSVYNFAEIIHFEVS